MVITKNDRNIKDEGWRYVYEGSINTEKEVKFELDKYCFIIGSIEAGWYIKAGESIKAGGSIEAGCCTWRKIADEDKIIRCSKLNGKVEYGILEETGEEERETIEFNGKKYDKEEFEKRLEELEPID